MMLILAASLVGFAWVTHDRLTPLWAAKPDHTRTGAIVSRITGMFVYGFGQKRMVDDIWPGLLHIFIFAGFVVVSLRTVTMIGLGFKTDFHLPLMAGPVGDAYLYLKDAINLLILVGCAGNLWRR